MLIQEFKGQFGNTVRFICADNLEFMNEAVADMQFQKYHLAVVDPPYGIDVTKMNLGKSKEQIEEIKKKYDRGEWDSKPPPQEYWTALFYLSRKQVIFGANYFLEYLGNCERFYLWDKEQAAGLSFADCELAWTSFEGAPKIIKRSRQKDKKHEKIHDTQKPVYLYDALFLDLIQKGDLKKGQRVLDTHGGSHNIAIAAWRHGLSLDVIEQQEQHHLSGIENFKKHTIQNQLIF